MAENFVPSPLPVGVKEPGVYVTLFTDGDPGLSASNNRCLLLGYMSDGGTFRPNEPIRVLNRDQIEVGAMPYSMLAHQYLAAKSQVPLGTEIWCCPLLAPSGGTAQIMQFEIIGEPSAGVLSSATTAAAADVMTVRYRGRGVAIDIAAGQAFETIATNFKTAWDAVYNAPATCGVSSAVVSLTARHKGLHDDGALEVSFLSKGASGCAARVGTLTYNGVAGVASAGTSTLTLGKHTAQVAITDTETAAAAGTAMLNKINGDAYPVRAAQPASPTGAVSLLFVNGRPIRPLGFSHAYSGVTTQTAALSVGTAGSGVPTLTSALANLGQLDDYHKAWGIFWLTTSELSATATYVEAAAAPTVLKQSVVAMCSTSSLATIGTADITNATTPKLSSSARYVVGWSQLDGNAGFETAARFAAAIAAENDPGRNWNNFKLVGSTEAPIVGIHPGDRPTLDERNTAIASYRYAPLTVTADGNMTLKWGGTSYKAKSSRDAKLTKLSGRLTLDYYASDLVVYLGPYVSKKLKLQSEPRTDKATTLARIEGAIKRWMRRLDDVDLFDGAEANGDAVRAAIFVAPGRVDINIPFVPLQDIDVLAPVGILS